jgi:hypothetical protein
MERDSDDSGDSGDGSIALSLFSLEAEDPLPGILLENKRMVLDRHESQRHESENCSSCTIQ